MTDASTTPGKLPNRWLIAIMGTVLQITLGTIYAWSFFQNDLMAYGGWNNQQVAMILMLAICFLGIAAAVGGVLLPKVGPRKLAVSGALLYALGWVIGGFALASKNLALLYLGLGVVGGLGLGLGYVTPVATAAKWFPDRKGFITGMVVMGFGLGALFISLFIGPMVINACTTVVDGVKIVNWPTVFYCIAAILGVPGVIAASFFCNPPAGYVPAGYTPPAVGVAGTVDQGNLTAKMCIFSAPFWLMWFIFFCNITAGIMFIGFQKPILQDLLKISDPGITLAALTAAGGILIACSSIFNGIGRFFWGGLSDKIGRIQAFRLIIGSQILVFTALVFVSNPWIFSILVCYILLCYGGGFGTAPSFVMTVFGSKVMAVVYGTLLTAWSMAGLVGPKIVAYFRDNYKEPGQAATYTFITGACILGAGLLVSFLLSNKQFSRK